MKLFIFQLRVSNSKVEKEKLNLQVSNSKFNSIFYEVELVIDIWWWEGNVNHLYHNIVIPNSETCITTDASSYGWSAVMDSQSTGSLLSTTETYQCTRAESNLTWFESFDKRSNKS